MVRQGKVLVGAAVAAWLLGGSGLPVCADHFLVRGGSVVGRQLWGFSAGADYLRDAGGHKPLLVSLDWAVNIVPIFSWESDISAEVSELAALVVSRPVRGGSPLLLGVGAISADRFGEGKTTRPLLRLTLTSGFSRVLVGQIRLSAAPSLGVLTDFSLGVGF